jgi:hypothetical protein
MQAVVLWIYLLLSSVPTSSADDVDVIRARTRALFQPSLASLPSVVATANKTVASLNATCYFPDIDYFQQSRANWAAIVHLDRLAVMVQALTTPGSPSFDAPYLSTAVHCTLGAWIFHKPLFTDPNWWYFWIGEPVRLQSMYLLLGANRTTPLEQATLYNFSLHSAYWINDYGGGDNLSDMLRVQLYRGIATNNLTAISLSFSILFSTVVVGEVTTPGFEGVMTDQSYHFHGIQILSSAYGDGWASTILSIFSIAVGTQWALPGSAAGVLARFLVEGDFALTHGRRWDYGTQGRGIDRPGLSFGWSWDGDALRGLANDGGEDVAPWKDGLLAFARSLDGEDVGSLPGVAGNTHFWTSDFMSHKRPGWGATFKGYGNNSLWAVVGNECDNDENQLGEYTGAGVVNVYTSSSPDNALESYGGIFPLWDWVRLNGVTAEARPPVPCHGPSGGDLWKVINTAFVGGVSDGVSGIVAHDTALHTLTAQRTFLFLDGAVVGLVGNVTSLASPPLPTRTTLVSRLLPSTPTPSLHPLTLGFANGSISPPQAGPANWSFPPNTLAWVHGGGLGVYPDPTLPTSIELVDAQGNYDTIGPFSGAVSGRLWSVWQDHGEGVVGGAGVFTLTPNVTAGDVGGGKGRPGCIVNQAGVQGGGDALGLLLGAVVWDRAGGGVNCSAAFQPPPSSGGVGGAFSVDGDGIFLVRSNATHATASAAHPALWAAGGVRNVVVGGKGVVGQGQGCKGNTITLTLPPAGFEMGKTVATTCALVA